MTRQNSIYSPTPFAVAKGGTANNTALTDGQLWIGRTSNTPAINTLTAGTNITITNGPGSINIGTSGWAAFSWSTITTNTTMTEYNGYMINATNITLQTPSSPSSGHNYSILGTSSSNGFTIIVSGGQTIQYNGLSGTQLVTLNVNGGITLLCTTAGTSGIFDVFSTNGATFVLS